MGYLDLISAADVAQYTGSVYDSAATLMLEEIIIAVIQQAEQYCDTEFLSKLRYERLSLGDGLFTPRYNVQRVNGLFTGVEEVITVTAPGFAYSLSVAKDSTDESILLLQGPSSYSEITIGTKLMSTIVSDINSVGGGWVAVAGTSYTAGAMAGTIWDGDYTGDNSNQFKLLAANTKVNCSRLNKKTYQCQEMTNDGILIYTSGYSTLPADLKDCLIRFIIQSYTDRTVANTQTVKSESLGDWSATYMTQAEQSGGGSSVGSGSLSLKLSYYDVLNRYKNYDI